MTLAADTLIVKDLLTAMFESALGKTGADANSRAKAVIDGFFPGAFSGQVEMRSLTITAGTTTAAGQGTGADTDGTPRTYDIGAGLPDGALLIGYIVDLETSFTGNTTLDLQVGVTGDVDAICAACDLMGTAGHTQGTAGATPTGLPSAPQLLATVTPDVASKVSEAATGSATITVFYVDAT